MTEQNNDLRNLVAQVASAYFSNSHVGASDIGSVIQQIAASLGAVGEAPSAATPAVAGATSTRATQAQIRKSITPEAIISFEDGRGYKTLKRHLSIRGLSPEQYREKWGLPRDYPMVAASYSEARSKMAKNLGLGVRAAASRAPATKRRRAPATAQG